MILQRFTIYFCLGLLLNGCASSQRTAQSISDAQKHGFSRTTKQTQGFNLTVFEKISAKGAPVVFYLEGDGHSMQSKYLLSTNPTPHQPLALELATLDYRDNVVYIARPCQYTPLEADPNCNRIYWSTHRFADEVIFSTSEIIDHYKSKLKPSAIHLVGFSGGGGLSVLVAGNRNDIDSVTTVAGDLDTDLMTSHHKTTPQFGSQNPIHYASQLKVKQLHLSGEDDKAVPPAIALSYMAKVNQGCVHHKILNGFSHHNGWKENWPALLQQLPCQNESL